MSDRVINRSVVLAAKVEEWRHRPFEYGTADCFQMTGDIVLALTGIDYRPQFPRYASRAAALRILRKYGGSVGLVTSVLGPSKPVCRAMEGDVLAGDFGEGIAAGICLGVKCCAIGPHGLIFPETASALAAWSI